jgi:hypothetical protein
MVACYAVLDKCAGHGRGGDALNWTVLIADTSQPNACMTNVAMVLPT